MCAWLVTGADDVPDVRPVLAPDAGRLHDGVPRVDVLGRVLVTMAARNSSGERQVGGHLPEGYERYPDHALEDILTGRLVDPVRLAEDQPRTPPDDWVGRVHQVHDPA